VLGGKVFLIPDVVTGHMRTDPNRSCLQTFLEAAPAVMAAGARQVRNALSNQAAA
jgi:hypothetical protein